MAGSGFGGLRVRWGALLSGAILLATAAAAPTRAADGLDFQLVAQIGGSPRDIVTEGTRVYFAAGRAILVGDLGPDDAIVPIGLSPPLPADVERLTVRDGWLYAALGQAGLCILDARDPAAITVTGCTALPGSALAVVLSGDLAFVAAGTLGGLQVVDLADPTQPRRIGGLDTPGAAVDVAVADHTVFMADGDLGLDIIDISNPARPRRGATVPSGIRADAVILDRDVLYVVDRNVGLRTLDARDPRRVTPLAAARVAGDVLAAAIDGTIGHLLARSRVQGQGLLVARLDLTDPANPIVVNTVPASNSGARGFALWRDRLLIGAEKGGMGYVINRSLEGPYYPATQNLDVPMAVTAAFAAPDGPAAALATGNGILLLRLLDPPRPPLPVALHESHRGLAVLADHVYLTTYIGGSGPSMYLRAISLDDQLRMRERRDVRVELPATPLVGPAVTDRALFLASGYKVAVLSLNVRDKPYAFEPVRVPINVTALAADGDRLVVIGEERFGVMDVGYPSRPTWLGELDAQAAGPAVVKGRWAAFRTTDSAGRVVDLADPRAPRVAVRLPGNVTALAIDDQHLYAAHGQTITAYRLTEPVGEVAGRLSIPTSLSSLAVHGDQLLVGTQSQGLLIYAMRPLAPTETPTPTPTPTATPEPATATPTRTVPPPTVETPAATATATPTATSGRPIGPLWLPVAFAGG
jgi:hypothetical protein